MKPQNFHETEDEVGRKGLLSWLWCKSSSENAVDGRKEGANVQDVANFEMSKAM